MHLPRNALAALLLLPCILPAAPPIDWPADLASHGVATLFASHGETRDIVCPLSIKGTPYVPGTATAKCSTNGFGGLGWDVPVALSSNVAAIAWSPAVDPGAEFDFVALRLTIDGTHTADALLHLRPGEAPGGPLPPPTQVLDFATQPWTNAPWALPSDIPAVPAEWPASAITNAPWALPEDIPQPAPETDPTIPEWAKAPTPPEQDLSGYATTSLVESLHPPFREYASSTYDRITAEAVPESVVETTKADAVYSGGRARGYALHAVRASRAGGMDTETDIEGQWSIVGATDAAVLSSNVLYCTSAPGDVTVEFSPSDGGTAIRAAVSMPGDAVRTATVWPSGEAAGSWRHAVQTNALALADAMEASPIRLVQTNDWYGPYVCTSRVAAMPFLSATAHNPEFVSPAMAQALCVFRDRRDWRSDGGSIGGGYLGVSEHYALYSVHSGGTPQGTYHWTTNWAADGQYDFPQGYANVASWGDLGLRRFTKGIVPPECRATFLRESTLASLSESRLFRSIAFAHTQHGAISQCLVEPRPSKADLTGSTWDGGWVYRASRSEWRNADWAAYRETSHAAHGGDSGQLVFFWIGAKMVPIGLFHWASGAGECLLSDPLLDKIAAAIERDSGGAEHMQFYTVEDLQ